MRYNDSLKEKHAEDRENTIRIVQNAIESIKEVDGENTKITAKKILTYCNLSRSVLYKPHILKIWNPEVWEKRYVIKSKIEEKLQKEYQKELEAAIKEIETLTYQLEKANREINNLKEKLQQEKNRSRVYKEDYEEEKIKNQKLLGECQRLANELIARGFEV